MTIKELRQMVAEITWMFGQHYLLETPNGNFIYSSPDYYGDGSVIPYDGTYGDYLKQTKIPFGRSKGTRLLDEFLSENAFLKEEGE